MRVRVKFLSAEEGGRGCGPPVGNFYAGVARVVNKHDMDEAYSLRLFSLPKDLKANEEIEVIAVAICPEQFKTGDIFKMYEGAQVVGEGIVVEDARASITNEI